MNRVSQKIRQQIRERAGGRCEYCYLPELYGITRFHADHIIPVRRHLGSKSIENLAWACVSCNTNKSSDIASYDTDTRQLTPLYNPRSQLWDDHFEITDGFIIGKTPSGRVTARLLEMNILGQVEMRRYLIKAGLW
ncbi:MAG: HNH endonuclease signature motif containing protein [Chloroflexota bacterium]